MRACDLNEKTPGRDAVHPCLRVRAFRPKSGTPAKVFRWSVIFLNI